MNPITVILTHNDETERLELPYGSDAGAIREHTNVLEALGVPDRFTLGVNGVGVDDSKGLNEGDRITFRPVDAAKGA